MSELLPALAFGLVIDAQFLAIENPFPLFRHMR
jgi:hypothetical protein